MLLISFNNYRVIGLSILMIGCDVSATARPWDMHKVTVDWLMEEFHKQVIINIH